MGNLRESLQIQVVSKPQGVARIRCLPQVAAKGSTKFWQCAYTRVVTHVMTMSYEKETMTGSSEM
jgi:hypothetical protein